MVKDLRSPFPFACWFCQSAIVGNLFVKWDLCSPNCERQMKKYPLWSSMCSMKTAFGLQVITSSMYARAFVKAFLLANWHSSLTAFASAWAATLWYISVGSESLMACSCCFFIHRIAEIKIDQLHAEEQEKQPSQVEGVRSWLFSQTDCIVWFLPALQSLHLAHFLISPAMTHWLRREQTKYFHFESRQTKDSSYMHEWIVVVVTYVKKSHPWEVCFAQNNENATLSTERRTIVKS